MIRSVTDKAAASPPILSWRLWRALNHPPLRSPLFRRAYADQYPPPSSGFPAIRIPFIGVFRNFSLVILPVVLILLGAPIIALLYYLALSLAVFLLPVANTIYGLAHAINASAGITRERERQTYDVLCAALPGSLGMHWAYCTGWLHYHLAYRYAVVAILVTGIVASVFGLSAQLVFGGEIVPVGVTVIRALALGTFFIVDFAQSIVVSSLTTLIIPSYAADETNARLYAAGVFLTLQSAVYFSTIMVAGYGLPGVFALFGFSADLSAMLIPLLMLAFFVALRELLITGLWRIVEQQLSTSIMELDAVSGRAL